MANQGVTLGLAGATRSWLEVQVGSLVYGCQTLESSHSAPQWLEDSPEAEKGALCFERALGATKRREEKGKNLNAGAERSASRNGASLRGRRARARLRGQAHPGRGLTSRWAQRPPPGGH
jgi:hypothetical protein